MPNLINYLACFPFGGVLPPFAGVRENFVKRKWAQGWWLPSFYLFIYLPLLLLVILLHMRLSFYLLFLCSLAYTVLSQDVYPPAHARKPKYTIMDNDWGSSGFIPFLLALNADIEVLGLTGDTANTWALQSSLHGLALLEHGDLDCIPVALGASYPLELTLERFRIWTRLWGSLVWEGVFAPENLTLQAQGNDPTGCLQSYQLLAPCAYTVSYRWIPSSNI